jgi:hypothetical protein
MLFLQLQGLFDLWLSDAMACLAVENLENHAK